ncbi:MAG: D-alanyl-D-alanine carboxypeptidase/D-alanyl-D-alanine-endopeptidase [Leptolyngbya sp. SIO1D8]|nr:D-alanyl-D-alanine carboxypeptidase/D-alanyl-D-alanine-endopeptidase [Leptolyngbya sp. SIO1D8]
MPFGKAEHEVYYIDTVKFRTDANIVSLNNQRIQENFNNIIYEYYRKRFSKKVLDSRLFIYPGQTYSRQNTFDTDRNPQALSIFREQLEIINRYSDNTLADDLLRTIGGQHAVQAALSSIGVEVEGYQQADGSGLSRSNRAKPSTFITLLKAMHETDNSRIFYNSLPISGVNGTLEHRFKGTPVQGQVHAKTGTLNGVRALSGYVETPNYGTVAFSIMVNQPGQSGSVLLQAIDEMVLNIARVEPCR